MRQENNHVQLGKLQVIGLHVTLPLSIAANLWQEKNKASSVGSVGVGYSLQS